MRGVHADSARRSGRRACSSMAAGVAPALGVQHRKSLTTPRGGDPPSPRPAHLSDRAHSRAPQAIVSRRSATGAAERRRQSPVRLHPPLSWGGSRRAAEDCRARGGAMRRACEAWSTQTRSRGSSGSGASERRGSCTSNRRRPRDACSGCGGDELPGRGSGVVLSRHRSRSDRRTTQHLRRRRRRSSGALHVVWTVVIGHAMCA